ncbi:MAG: class II fructose-bisphosphate aldolase [Eubacteriales bacterium]|nr:class II fructose-bisphosphate aldolase [Eubacteriales bacterium]
MIISLGAILEIAEARNIAIAAFNVTTLEGVEAVLAAAEELNQPVILQFANAAHSGFISMDVIGSVMVDMAEKSTVPVCVHLDHGANFAEVQQALELGFSSVMYDGSTLSFAENVANTRAVVELAEAYGASVEAEIGSMGREEFASAGADDQDEIESCYTDPDQAAEFVAETGVDALACSFGTVHGIYVKAPKLDIERIGEIREKTGVPIVMHGGSGISDEDFRKCIEQGVRKINFYTYAAKDAGAYIKEKLNQQEGNVYFHDIAVWGRESMKKTYMDTIKVFSDLK